jgi:hypothetical protein
MRGISDSDHSTFGAQTFTIMRSGDGAWNPAAHHLADERGPARIGVDCA